MKGGVDFTCYIPVRTGILSERLQDGSTAILISPTESDDAVDIIEVGTVAMRDHTQTRLHTVPSQLLIIQYTLLSGLQFWQPSVDNIHGWKYGSQEGDRKTDKCRGVACTATRAHARDLTLAISWPSYPNRLVLSKNVTFTLPNLTSLKVELSVGLKKSFLLL
jgi:hypothetical protein